MSALTLSWLLVTSASARDPEVDALRDTLENELASVSERFDAATRLAEVEPGKAAKFVFEVALEATTPYGLQVQLADVLASVPSDRSSDKVQKQIRQLVGDRRAPVTERLFALRAMRRPESSRDAKTLLQAFQDDDALVRQSALDTAERLELSFAIEELRDLLETARKEDELQPAGGAWLEALDALQGEAEGFDEELLSRCDSPLRSVRTASVRLLAARLLDREGGVSAASRPARTLRSGLVTVVPELQAGDEQIAKLLERSLGAEHWTERLAGVRLAQSLPPLVSVPHLLAAFADQSGRMQREFECALKTLTGRAAGGDAQEWTEWWSRSGRPALLKPHRAAAETSRPRRSTLDSRGGASRAEARFFNLDVTSHAVVFVLDVSGSMDWPAYYVGDPGQGPLPYDDGGETRMDLAREHLHGALADLDPEARYNIVAFNDRARPWLTRKGLAEFGKAGKRADDAAEYVDALSPNDGTNLYAGLRAAFDDPHVDTIYLLSDGVPSLGEHIEPELIRRSVQAWNAQRHVTVNVVALGLDAESNPLARLLAEDSGGRFVELP